MLYEWSKNHVHGPVNGIIPGFRIGAPSPDFCPKSTQKQETFHWGCPPPNPKPQPQPPPRFLSKIDRFFDINTKTTKVCCFKNIVTFLVRVLLGAGPPIPNPNQPRDFCPKSTDFLTSTQKQQTFGVLNKIFMLITHHSTIN